MGALLWLHAILANLVCTVQLIGMPSFSWMLDGCRTDYMTICMRVALYLSGDLHESSIVSIRQNRGKGRDLTVGVSLKSRNLYYLCMLML